MPARPTTSGDEVGRIELDELTRQRLLQFARRRERLLWWRGGLAALAATLGGLLLITAVDAAWVLDDSIRITLSLGAWVLGGLELWRLTLRHLRGRRDLTRLARWFESARPELREEVLSAVELGTQSAPKAGLDSPAFRARLQAVVAERLAAIEPEQLLPWKLIRKWMLPATVAMLLVGMLITWPNLHGTHRLIRAALPTANLARVSRTHLEVCEPSPADAIVPLGNAVPIVVDASGRRITEAWLETTAGGRRVRTRMRPIARDRFAASIEAVDATIFYRARGGDAVTRWYRIVAVPPPRVVAFEKTYHPPHWLNRPALTVREASGDLEGVEGTRVDLRLESDQPLRDGELRLDFESESQTVRLERVAPHDWRTSLDLTRPGLYQARLIAADSGFENHDRPMWEIRVRPDQPPQVEVLEPAADRTATPDDLIRWSVQATDDHGLVTLQRRIQIRRASAGWRDDGAAHVCTGETAAIIETTDLLALGVRPGDEVWVKYVATDLRGQAGESSVRRLMIATEAFEPGRRTAVEAWRRVSTVLERVTVAAREARQAQADTRRAAESQTSAETDRAAVRAHSRSAIHAAERAAEIAAQVIDAAQRDLASGPNARALEQIAIALAAIRHSELAVARRMAITAETGAKEEERAALEETTRRLQRAVELAEQIARVADHAGAAEEVEVAVADLRDVREELRRAAEAPSDTPADHERLARRQAVAAAHMNEVAELLRSTERRAGGIREAARKLAAAADAATRADEGARNAARLPQLARTVEETLATVVRSAAEIQRDASQALSRLGEEHSPRKVLERLSRELAAAAQTKSGDGVPTVLATERTLALRDAAVALLRDRAALEERQRDTDSAFVQDLHAAASAVRVAATEPTGESARMVGRIAEALRRVETAHEASGLARELHALAADERWGRPDDRQTRARARVWRGVEEELVELQRALREQQVPKLAEAVNHIHSMPDTVRAREEMDRRRGAIVGRDNVANEVRAVANAMSTAAQEIRLAAEDSRRWLASLVPPLSERLAAARQDMRRARELTQAAARVEDQAARAAVHDALQQQVRANEDLDDLRRLLRADAAAQDLANPSGRERARDADDALAMLREPPPRAEDLLRAAAAAPDPARRSVALEQAASQQSRLEETLGMLADHYRQLEEGSSEGRRSELRSAEAEAGLTAALDQQYRHAVEMATLARDVSAITPEALERLLADNPAMQAALDRLSRALLRDAASAVREAAETERRLAQSAARVARELDLARETLRERAERLARDAAALAGETLQPVAREAAATVPDMSAPITAAAEAAAAAAEALRSVPNNRLERAVQMLTDSAAGLRRAVEGASEAGQKAENAARSAQERGDSAAAARAGDLAQRSRQGAAQASELARAAEDMAAQARAALKSEQGVIEDGVAQQPGVISQTDSAGAAAERAGRHQQRLGRNVGDVIVEAGRRTRETAANEMSQARDAIGTASATTAAAPLEIAANEASHRANELDALITTLPSSMSAPAGDAHHAEAAEWLARALDRSDATAIAAEAVVQAAQAQAAAMARARVQGLVPGEAPRSGASVQAEGRPGPDEAEAPKVWVGDDWAKLPPDVARELRAARAESVPEEYRMMVELYFKAISREARTEPR